MPNRVSLLEIIKVICYLEKAVLSVKNASNVV